MTEDQLNRIEERTANFTKNGTNGDVSWFAGYAEESIPTLIAEVRRLRALLKQAEWAGAGADEPYTACPWCQIPYEFHPSNQKPHRDGCAAFSPDGKLK